MNNDNLRTILHCDANNFYASVECALNPELRDKPIAVVGDPEKRHGIILAKSTLAKACGVSTGEPIWQAKQKCPNLLVVPPHYDKYVEYSDKLFYMYNQFTDRVEPFGIDECWLDCTASLKLFGSGATIANTLRKRAKEELGLTISVGVSFTKIFAKLGSDMKKPDATTIISPDNYQSKVWRLPARDLLMVGRRTSAKLQELGINTIGDLAVAKLDLLTSKLGVNGKTLHDYANGKDTDDVRLYFDHHIPESIGHGTTTPKDITTLSQANAVLVGLCEMVATRLRHYDFNAGGISLGIKYKDLEYTGKQAALLQRTSSAKELHSAALSLLNELYTFGKDLPIRALSVATFHLAKNQDTVEIGIFDKDLTKIDSLEDKVDNIRTKYGYKSLQKGILMAHDDIVDHLEVSEFKPFKK